SELNLPVELRGEFDGYLAQVQSEDSNPKDPEHQNRVYSILQKLIESGEKDMALLIYNIHRTFTGYRGYDANDSATSDIDRAFGAELNIPDEGVILVEYFVTRNLPAIVEALKVRGVDLKRLRV